MDGKKSGMATCNPVYKFQKANVIRFGAREWNNLPLQEKDRFKNMRFCGISPQDVIRFGDRL
ncbi:uncharacterized protein [Drosophila suzukii]|uniref:Uncharacterized protein isoform X3 n=1 Tax=Drosophila suzukii TaxID=28584 RepID=A0ABM4TUF2_DROSZ